MGKPEALLHNRPEPGGLTMSTIAVQQCNATIPVKEWTPDRRFIQYDYAKPTGLRPVAREGDRPTPTRAESQDAMAALVKIVREAPPEK